MFTLIMEKVTGLMGIEWYYIPVKEKDKNHKKRK